MVEKEGADLGNEVRLYIPSYLSRYYLPRATKLVIDYIKSWPRQFQILMKKYKSC